MQAGNVAGGGLAAKINSGESDAFVFNFSKGLLFDLTITGALSQCPGCLGLAAREACDCDLVCVCLLLQEVSLLPMRAPTLGSMQTSVQPQIRYLLVHSHILRRPPACIKRCSREC